MQDVSHTDSYGAPYWFLSQLFDPDWTPRETLEHSPAAEPVV